MTMYPHLWFNLTRRLREYLIFWNISMNSSFEGGLAFIVNKSSLYTTKKNSLAAVIWSEFNTYFLSWSIWVQTKTKTLSEVFKTKVQCFVFFLNACFSKQKTSTAAVTKSSSISCFIVDLNCAQLALIEKKKRRKKSGFGTWMITPRHSGDRAWKTLVALTPKGADKSEQTL